MAEMSCTQRGEDCICEDGIACAVGAGEDDDAGWLAFNHLSNISTRGSEAAIAGQIIDKTGL